MERTYCKHLFHYQCLDEYMKKPPFTGSFSILNSNFIDCAETECVAGGKQCVVCGSRIYHNKWHISPELAEARWAHKEAKHRELDEVKDFFQ